MVEVRFSHDALHRSESVTRDSKQSQIESSGATRGHLVAQKHPQSKKDSQRDSQTALQAAWCSNTRQRAHPQTQIAGRHVHEQPFENIAMSAQMSSAHPSRVVQMRCISQHLI